MESNDDRERWRVMMMGFLDGELDEGARREFMTQLQADRELAEELAQYKRLSDVASSMRLCEPEDAELERVYAALGARIERGLGFMLIYAGATVLAGFFLYALAIADVHIAVKLGGSLLVVGAALLVASVARGHLAVRRLDRYQGVRR